VRIESPRPLGGGGAEVQHRRLQMAELLTEAGA
jgi:hypothetical protein